MKVIHTAMFVILQRFPERAETIKRLFSESKDFQCACEDFRQCRSALRFWKQSMKAEAPARRLEYATLLRELEQEIEQRVIEAGSPEAVSTRFSE